jgi:hypothetical protein
MNVQSYCRELMDNGRRCGLLHGHHGEHCCCTLHDRKPQTWHETKENY